tara:strand:+ start:220 stop:633 length:414 start_codon:yes stop_codon:yes gene_type:complete
MDKLILIFISLLVISCDDNFMSPQETNDYLNLQMNTTLDNNGFYLIDYPDWEVHSYTSVQYETLPYTRVFWTSEDTFTAEHWGQEIIEPIINFSTYSDSDGLGQQMIYLYQDFIGDTLMVYGCTENDTCSSLNFIVY